MDATPAQLKTAKTRDCQGRSGMAAPAEIDGVGKPNWVKLRRGIRLESFHYLGRCNFSAAGTLGLSPFLDRGRPTFRGHQPCPGIMERKIDRCGSSAESRFTLETRAARNNRNDDSSDDSEDSHWSSSTTGRLSWSLRTRRYE
jgi:hypothetical protein